MKSSGTDSRQNVINMHFASVGAIDPDRHWVSAKIISFASGFNGSPAFDLRQASKCRQP